jgi:DnaJ-class molecular chaperone
MLTTDALHVLGLDDGNQTQDQRRRSPDRTIIPTNKRRIGPAELRAAFRSACLRTHPDKTGDAADAAAFARVLDAYRALQVEDLPDDLTDSSSSSNADANADPNADQKKPAADHESWARLADAFLASLLGWMNRKKSSSTPQPTPRSPPSRPPVRVAIDVGVLDACCGAFTRVVLRRQQDRHELFVRVETERGAPNLVRLAYRFAAGPAVGPDDVSVRVRLQPQGGFAWRPPGPDLELVHVVPLDRWIAEDHVEVPMPDGQSFASVPNPRDGSRLHAIPGAGMPIGAFNGGRLRGSLFVRIVPCVG